MPGRLPKFFPVPTVSLIEENAVTCQRRRVKTVRRVTTKLPDDLVLQDGHDEEGLGDHDPGQVKENVIDEVVAVAEGMVPLRSDANLRVTPSTSA